MSSVFVDVSALPKDINGLITLLYLGATYAFVLLQSSNLIKDGSELLLLIPSCAGIVGSIVLPVLGAVPDGAIVLFSGLGPNAAEQVSVGVGALAGSTVMLLTVPWFLSIMAGRVNFDKDGNGMYLKPKGAKNWSKLSPPDRILGSGVNCGPVIAYTAKVMLVTLIPFLIIQIPSLYANCAYLKDERHCEPQGNYALIGGVIALALFAFYLWDQARIANSDSTKQDKIDQLRMNAIKHGLVTLRGLFPDQCMDSEGVIHIDSNNKRFRNFLRPFFHKFDEDNSGTIDAHEFAAVVHSLGERPDKENIDKMMAEMDRDGSGSIDFDEFAMAIADLLLNKSVVTASAPADDGKVTVEKVSANEDDEAEEEEEQEDEIPDDLQHLSPKKQQQRILLRSLWMMGLGVGLVLIFSDPMVDILSELGNRTGVKPFYVAFILAPLASNASELIAAYAYALKKTEKTVTISFSSLLGAACMNNTLCLAIFLFLVWAKNLKWVFSAETMSIITVELVMFFFAQRRSHPTWYAFIVLAMMPLCILEVYGLEAIGFD